MTIFGEQKKFVHLLRGECLFVLLPSQFDAVPGLRSISSLLLRRFIRAVFLCGSLGIVISEPLGILLEGSRVVKCMWIRRHTA